MSHQKTTILLVLLLTTYCLSASAQTNVNAFAPSTNTDLGIWFESDLRQAGTASVVDLSGLGGSLEVDQPLPPGAALITTELDNGDKAEVGALNDYGMPNDIFASLTIAYSFLKADNMGQNLFAAPALNLTFFNPLCDDPVSANDCFGSLIYEPTWNGPTSTAATPVSSAVALDVWTQVDIDQGNGLLWWTGGFGQPNSAGGPPINTLSDWLTLFSSDFGDATLIEVSLGVGTFNQGQIGYFDDVQISHNFAGGFSESFDFGPAPALPPIVPVPALSTISQALLLLGLLCVGIVSIRQQIRRLHHFDR